ncbi:MAG: hypothetical protein ACKVVT_10995 [Dehalococcoidia bacterium]
MLIAVPGLISAIGIVLVILGISINHDLVRQILLAVGLGLIWFDFFVGMAHQRRALRDIDRRLRAIEQALGTPGR